ncbi:GNAT family N-acetyltransferase [Sphingomonas sp. SUN039]|uniref:GNAT family N-acetyltransferase n=1 Tax=Sphingomonas sp. SUN039 TaxID=2937787 RepID=UPI002164915B|nr:GNAT family N-acetyltransferase [Sphingomonas sp. SUN039]UVO53290.1 GNAT family N-acetyltransferase [Sphingomonas sp. SUN039]
MWVKGEIFRDFADAESAARGSLDREAGRSLFDRLDWFRRTWTHCTPGDRPLIVRARAEGSDAWLFLAETGNAARGLASWYTLAFRLIVTGAPPEATARALIVAIARRLRSRLASIMLDHVPEAEAELLRSGFARAGWVARVTPQTANWSIDVTGKTFAEFWAERPGQLRSTAKRKAAKTPMELSILDRFDADAWDDYASIYADSWKPEEGSLDFVRAMAQDEGAAGALRLGIARIEGRAVAAQLWTVEHGVAIIHKLAHREDVAELSPGTILSQAMFEHVIDRDRVDLIDFGTGDDRYKADWMDTRVMRMRVELYNPRKPSGLIGAAKSGLRALVGRGRSG